MNMCLSLEGPTYSLILVHVWGLIAPNPYLYT